MSSSSKPLAFKSQYDNIVGQLQAMIQTLMRLRMFDRESIGRDITIFLDDMLLRLRLWAADVQVDEGSLDWVEHIEPVAAALQDLLYHVDREVQTFDASTKPLLGFDKKGTSSL